MAGTRLANRQRQLAEQGRLRLGTYNGKYPMASKNWIVTSHSEEHARTAAELWGGTAERWKPQGNSAEQWRVITETNVIDAFLPPGDPLSQAYEMWGRGGCVRRCDGLVEDFSGSPCLCRAQFGESYHEQKQGTVCDEKSRLKVIIREMPGLGTWRMETGSFYAADEIAGMIDLILSTVGDRAIVPVRLRIVQRTRVAGGQTKQFVVPVVELRGATAGELIDGTANLTQVSAGQPARAVAPAAARPALGGGQAAAIEAPKDQQPATKAPAPAMSRESYLSVAATCPSIDDLTELLAEVQAAGYWDTDMQAHFVQQRERLAQKPIPAATDTDALDGTVEDPDALWQQIVAAAGALGWTTSQVEEHFAAQSGGLLPADAGAGEMRRFLDWMRRSREAVTP